MGEAQQSACYETSQHNRVKISPPAPKAHVSIGRVKRGHSRIVPRLNIGPIRQLPEPPIITISPRYTLKRESNGVFLIHAVGIKIPVKVCVAEGGGGADEAVFAWGGGEFPVAFVPEAGKDLFCKWVFRQAVM